MNTEIYIEPIPKDEFNIVDLKPLVYDLIDSKSTLLNPIELEDVSCTVSWDAPPGIHLKDSDQYMYLIVEMPCYDD